MSHLQRVFALKDGQYVDHSNIYFVFTCHFRYLLRIRLAGPDSRRTTPTDKCLIVDDEIGIIRSPMNKGFDINIRNLKDGLFYEKEQYLQRLSETSDWLDHICKATYTANMIHFDSLHTGRHFRLIEKIEAWEAYCDEQELDPVFQVSTIGRFTKPALHIVIDE